MTLVTPFEWQKLHFVRLRGQGVAVQQSCETSPLSLLDHEGMQNVLYPLYAIIVVVWQVD